MKKYILSLIGFGAGLALMAQPNYQFVKTTQKLNIANASAAISAPKIDEFIDLGFNFPFDGHNISNVQILSNGIGFSYGNRIATIGSHWFDDDFQLVSVKFYQKQGNIGVFEFTGIVGKETYLVQLLLEANGNISYVYGVTSEPVSSLVITKMTAGLEIIEVGLPDADGLVPETVIYGISLGGSPSNPVAYNDDIDHLLNDFPVYQTCYRFLPVQGASIVSSNKFSVEQSLEGIKITNNLSTATTNYNVKNMQGVVLASGTFSGNELDLTQTLKTGEANFYIIELETNGHKEVKKIFLTK